ncbi:MAG: tetratricopeptide repeat protein [Cyanobacteriota bacterium]|nr:tetratricopeptide repeat protein [Cyanobacteriota bacterium]
MTTASEVLQLALRHHQNQRFTQARKLYCKILERQPDRPEALHGMGILARQCGEYGKAGKFLRAAIEARPNSVRSWVSLGDLRQAQGEFVAAIDCYQRAIELGGDSPNLRNNLGYALQQQGDWEGAIACYQKALELDANCTAADVSLANARFETQQLSLDRYEYYAQLNCDLGRTCEQAGDLPTATAYYQQALAMNPQSANAYRGLGSVLHRRGQFPEAIASYQKALELDPEDGQTYLHLGKLYQIQHQLHAAAAAYREGLKRVNPRYAEAIAARTPSETPAEERTPPQLQPGEVTLGGYSFPAIPDLESPTEKRPFWTVIVPLYNRTDYLLECFASILAQWPGFEEMEILVMDNASTPPLLDWVEAIGGGIVRYYRNPENLGARRNFNLGISLSRGRWIHVIPEDEYVLPNFYSQLKQSLETCPDSVGAAFTGYKNIDDFGRVVFSQQVYGEDSGIHADWLEKIGTANLLNPCAVLIRRETHAHLGGYDPDNTYTPDWELYKRIATFYDWWYEGEILACYRQHSNNMTSELLISGAQASSIRLGIEISQRYLPIDRRDAITANARNHYFKYCLKHLSLPLKAGNIDGAFRLLKEALKINSSPEAVAQVFAWLNTEEAAPLREKITLHMMGVKSDSTEESFYFAYP